ncbi:MAG: PH domain-containing protein [Rhizobiales bacterium]|nr:PH domain-containing protein [Hyphomicrobiales bacterium]
MGYLDRVLEPGETVAYEAKLSWVGYLPGIGLLAAAIVLAIVARLVIASNGWATAVGVVVLIPALYFLGKAWFDRWTTEIAITNRRVIFKWGFIRRHTIEMSLDKVESVDVSQSIVGRILNYGDVTVRGTGAGFQPLRGIDNPLQFRTRLTAH